MLRARTAGSTGRTMTTFESLQRDAVETVAAPDLSLVIPVMDEEGNVDELYRQLEEALASLPLRAEIIFVDDGSRDRTIECLERLYATDRRVNVLSLRRNFGKTAALLAGFELAQGEVVVTMDGDLQDDPAELRRFLDSLSTGFDLVSGWK